VPPCPRCGSRDIRAWKDESTYCNYLVQCITCGESGRGDTLQEAIDNFAGLETTDITDQIEVTK
jgi:Zn ribbon nucleic-acid-binding protein